MGQLDPVPVQENIQNVMMIRKFAGLKFAQNPLF